MAGGTDSSQSATTKLVTAGRSNDAHVVNPPVYRASTHLYADCAALREGPKSNRGRHLLLRPARLPHAMGAGDALTAIEPGAHGTVLYPSGVAAIAGALLAVVGPGDVLLVCDNAYDPSRQHGHWPAQAIRASRRASSIRSTMTALPRCSASAPARSCLKIRAA